MIPTKPGDRVKTDRRDCEGLSRLNRAGELTPVWVPDEEQEALRDLTRAREDMKALERMTKQRLNAFLLRYGRIYKKGKSRWTQAHFRWLEGVKFDISIQQIVFQEYVEAVKLVSAMTIMAELGDMTRFDSPRQLMSFLGLVPSEYSSGSKTVRGGITKTGNRHARRIFIESEWSYRFPARKTAHLQRSAEKCSEEVQTIAWKAQKRLCGRYDHLMRRGKLKVQVCTAVARELVGFVWAIACEVMNKQVVSTR